MKQTRADFEIIAIDGPSGVGKSSTARLLAQRMGYYFLSSGIVYRAMAWYALAQGWQEGQPLPPAQFDGVSIRIDEMGRPLIDGRRIEADLGAEAISRAASVISTAASVRDKCNEVQRETVAYLAGGQHYAGVILEGRDIATVVFPEATHKFFITARAEERARRRYAELAPAQAGITLEDVARAIEERDARDRTRDLAPLRPAQDAVVVDTSDLSLEQVVQHLISLIQQEPQDR